MGKTFRKIRGNGNFKSISFVESRQPLEIFKPLGISADPKFKKVNYSNASTN